METKKCGLFFIFATLIFLSSEVGCNSNNSVICPELSDTVLNNDPPFDTMPVPECFLPTFMLYTRPRKSPGVMMNTTDIPSEFHYKKTTVVIVHGFLDGPQYGWMTRMRRALLKKRSYNVIEVDWSEYCADFLNYPQAAANARTAGKAISDLFQALIANGLKFRKTYCIGHSLGAHICGYAGKEIKFGRITGLDPAAPYFDDLKNKYKLSKKDAKFVDVIHTDGQDSSFQVNDFGTVQNLGDLDFYPNTGRSPQPGCSFNKREQSHAVEQQHNKKGLVVKESTALSCSHGRARDLYIESIESRHCKATAVCTDYNTIALPSNSSGWLDWFWPPESSCTECEENCPEMGYYAIKYKKFPGMYYLETSDGVGQDFCLG